MTSLLSLDALRGCSHEVRWVDYAQIHLECTIHLSLAIQRIHQTRIWRLKTRLSEERVLMQGEDDAPEDTGREQKGGGGESFLDADSALDSSCRRQHITIKAVAVDNRRAVDRVL